MPFALLSDNEETLCNLFDVIKDKNMYGKKVHQHERSTFLIDKKGVWSSKIAQGRESRRSCDRSFGKSENTKLKQAVVNN